MDFRITWFTSGQAILPTYSAFLQSVFTGLTIYLFKLIKRTDHYYNMLTIFFLMCISFLPNPTSIPGEFITDGIHRDAVVSFYAFGILLPAIGWLVSWVYTQHNFRLLDTRLDPIFIKKTTGRFYFSNLLYVAALIMSFFSPAVSLAIIAGLAIVYLFPSEKPKYIQQSQKIMNDYYFFWYILLCTVFVGLVRLSHYPTFSLSLTRRFTI